MKTIRTFRPISRTTKAPPVILKVVSMLFLLFAATRAIADCGQRETAMPQDIEQRLAVATQFWEREYCFDISEIRLREIAEEARTQRRLRVEIAALLVLADMYDYDGRERAHAEVTDRLSALVDAGVTQEEAIAITLVEVDRLIVRRRYHEAQTRLTETIAHLENGSFPVDLKARAYMSRASVHFRLGLKAYGAACQEDAHAAIDLLTNHPEHQSLLGRGYWHLGRCEESGPQRFPYFDIALKLCRESADVRCQQDVLNSYAIYQRRAGRYQEALTSYQASLDIARRYEYRATVGMLLGNMANLYRVLNRNLLALETIRESIGITRALGSRYALSYRLEALGHIQLEAGSPSDAVEAFTESKQIREQAGYTYEKVIPAYGLGKALLALGRVEEAIAVLQQNKKEASNALNGLAFANTVIALGRIGRANAAELLMAAEMAHSLGVVEPEWDAMHVLAQQSAQQKNFDQSIFFGKQAVNLFQRVRALNSGMDRQAQRELLVRGMTMYKDLAGWLIAQGRMPEAQQVLAMLKEDEYYDFIRRDASADFRSTRASFTGQEAPWDAKLQAAGGRLTALGAETQALRKKKEHGAELSAAETQRLRDLETELETAGAAFIEVLDQLQQAFADVSDKTRYAELEKKGLDNDLTDVIASFGPDVVLLQYIVMPEGTHILLTTGATRLARKANVPQTELNQSVNALLATLKHPGQDPRPAAQKLYGYLIGPVAEDLKAMHTKTLMLSLDGVLRYVPMAALHDGEQYLAQRYALALYTDAARERLKDKPQSHWKIAGLGLTQAWEGFAALPAVKEELDGLVKTADSNGILPGIVKLDEQFNSGSFKETLRARFPVLHIASHFQFDPAGDTASFLLLGDGSRLSLNEIRKNGYSFAGVDLMTLSACQTGVGGGKDANGREIEGLGVLAQKQGAKGVIATLWPVADASTAQLMQSFYRLREEQKLSKAEALRQAQLALLTGKVGAGGTAERGGVRRADGQQTVSFVPDPNAPFAHPYYWAPFILMGNWL